MTTLSLIPVSSNSEHTKHPEDQGSSICFPSERSEDSKKRLISRKASTKYKMGLSISGTQIRRWSRIMNVKFLKFDDKPMVISD